jgi:hypothetical protein
MNEDLPYVRLAITVISPKKVRLPPLNLLSGSRSIKGECNHETQ